MMVNCNETFICFVYDHLSDNLCLFCYTIKHATINCPSKKLEQVNNSTQDRYKVPQLQDGQQPPNPTTTIVPTINNTNLGHNIDSSKHTQSSTSNQGRDTRSDHGIQANVNPSRPCGPMQSLPNPATSIPFTDPLNHPMPHAKNHISSDSHWPQPEICHQPPPENLSQYHTFLHPHLLIIETMPTPLPRHLQLVPALLEANPPCTLHFYIQAGKESRKLTRMRVTQCGMREEELTGNLSLEEAESICLTTSRITR